MRGDLDFDKAAVLLDALSHPARLKTLMLTSEREWDVTSLAAAVGLTQSALSQHLRKLRDAGLVDVRRDSQAKFYRCSHPGVAILLATVKDLREEF